MPRLTQPQFKAIAKTRALSDGSFAIRMRCQWKGQSQVSLGFSVPSLSDFDSKRGMVRKSCVNSSMFNKIIQSALLKCQQHYLSLVSSGTPFDSSVLLSCLREELTPDSCSGNTLSEVFCRYLSGKREGSKRQYRTVLSHLIKVYGDVDITLVRDGKRLWAYVEGLDWTDNTKRTFYALANAVFEWCREEEGVGCEFPIPKRQYKKIRRNVGRLTYLNSKQFEWLYTRYCIANIVDGAEYSVFRQVSKSNGYGRKFVFSRSDDEIIERSVRNPSWAASMYLAMVLFWGLAPVDMALLRLSDLKEEFIDGMPCWYVRGLRCKTGVSYNFPIIRNAFSESILLPYIRTAHKRGGYLFNIIRTEKEAKVVDVSDELSMRRKMMAFSNIINPMLKDLWMRMNEETKGIGVVDVEKTSLYSARHTFASLFLARDGSLGGLATGMGRSINTLGVYVHQINETSVMMEEAAKMDF